MLSYLCIFHLLPTKNQIMLFQNPLEICIKARHVRILSRGRQALGQNLSDGSIHFKSYYFSIKCSFAIKRLGWCTPPTSLFKFHSKMLQTYQNVCSLLTMTVKCFNDDMKRNELGTFQMFYMQNTIYHLKV